MLPRGRLVLPESFGFASFLLWQHGFFLSGLFIVLGLKIPMCDLLQCGRNGQNIFDG